MERTAGSRFGQNKLKNLIWDWNGTLLDDVEVNVEIINKMLVRRGLIPVSTALYKELFCFPVQAFQEAIGFDFRKESLESVAAEYHALYQTYKDHIRLNPSALAVLDTLRGRGIKQYILSAAGHTDLADMLRRFDLTEKFTGIYGAADRCASGKMEIGKSLMLREELDAADTVMVGDTLHDAEVARFLGISCILYAGGHNSGRLLGGKAPVITHLKSLLTL